MVRSSKAVACYFFLPFLLITSVLLLCLLFPFNSISSNNRLFGEFEDDHLQSRSNHLDYSKSSSISSTSSHKNHDVEVQLPLIISNDELQPKVYVDGSGIGEDHDDALALLRGNEKKKINISNKGESDYKLEKIERGLAMARAAIREAARKKTYANKSRSTGFFPSGPVYRNPFAFYQSHAEMVKRFKVWTYKEGEPPLVHQGPVSNIYGVEGEFIEEMESGQGSDKNEGIGRFLAEHPDDAHAFFLPFSVAKMVNLLYRPLVSYNRGPIQRVASDYVHIVSHKYPYWNRSFGADHFMLSCHDWGPDVSRGSAEPQLFDKMIRALCNANMSEGFHPNRDVAIPEVKIPKQQLGQLIGPPRLGVRLSQRKIFAFFAGGAHGYVRKVLFEHWRLDDKKKNKDDDDEIQVYECLPSDIYIADDHQHQQQHHQYYFKLMGESKFCLCPSGYEVASPRIAEAIHADCVPVLISTNYSLPFSDVLNWSEFSISIPVERIPDIKTILKGISTRRYLRLLKGVRSVSPHFTINRPAKPFDLMHMILHSVWLRRLNIKLPIK